MKTTPDSPDSCTCSRLVARLVYSLFGSVRYVAPPWLKFLGRHWGVVLALVLVLGAAGGGARWYLQWREAHRVHLDAAIPPVDVAVSVVRPEAAQFEVMADGSVKRVLSPLTIAFSRPAASLARMGAHDSPPEGEIALTPSLPGQWRWMSTQKLVFEPEADWLPGTEYRVKLGEGLLAPEVRPESRELVWKSRPLGLVSKQMKLEVDVKEGVCRFIGHVKWSHPVSLEAVKAQASLRQLDARDIAAGQDGSALGLEWSAGKLPGELFFRSSPVAVADEQGLADLVFAPTLTAQQGGKPLGKPERLRERVPSRLSLLHMAGAETRIVPDRTSGEPRRLLLLKMSSPVVPAEVEGHLELRVTSPDGDHYSQAVQWERALPLKLVCELTGEAYRRPTDTLVFSYEGLPDGERENRSLMVCARAGLTGIGGFRQPEDRFATCPQVPFPSSIHVSGDGCILQLKGEKKIRVTTRNVRYLLVTLGRVPGAQVPTLLATNWRLFRKPDRSYWYGDADFSFGAATHSVRRLVTLPAAPAGKTVATELDLSAYVARMPGSEGDCGVFVLKLEKVTPIDLGGERRETIAELGRREQFAWQGCVELLDAPDVVTDDTVGYQTPRLYAQLEGRWMRLRRQLADQRLLLLTDLGLIAKKDARLGRDVWAFSLHDGVPASHVEFRLVGRNGDALASSGADAEGHAFFAYDATMVGEREPLFLLARKGEDFSFLPASRIEAESWGRTDVWGIGADEIHNVTAAVFTERGIYRPGESVHVGFVLKREDWSAPLDGLPVTVEMIDARGKNVESFDTRLGPAGMGDWTVTLPESTPAGTACVRVREKDGREFGRTTLRVGDFEPDRMKLAGRFEGLAPGAAWLSPEKALYTLHVQNLYGTPAAGRRATATLVYGDETVSFPGWEGWEFFASGRKQEGQRLYEEKLGDARTDDDGNARFPLPLGKFASATYTLRVQAEAFEPGSGRSVTAESKTMISPWPWLMASKPDGNASWVPKGSAFAIDWAAVDSALKPVSPEGLRVTVCKRVERVELSRNDAGSYFYDTVRSWGEPLGEAHPLVLVQGRAHLPVDTAEVGTFRLSVHDASGNLRGECTYTVVGDGGSPDRADRAGEIQVSVENKTYRPGDTVEVSIQAPFAGSGLVTLEREKVWGWHVFKAEGTHAVVPLRIPDDAEGTLYATVCYLRAFDSPEVYRCPFASATVPLRVEKASRSNAVSLRVAPRAEAAGALEVAYKAQKPCRMILYAVDEGILQYTRYKLPDLRASLMKKRRLEVRTYEWLSLLLPEYRLLHPPSLFGGGGGEAEEGPVGFLNPFARQHEKSVVFWSGVVEAGPQEKTLVWQLPDYFSGTLHLMALAVGDESLGSAQAKVLVQAPIILMPTAPAFVAPGDHFRMNVNLTNMLGEEGAVPIEVTVQPSWVRAGGAPVGQTLLLAPGKDGNIPWEMQAPAEPGACSMMVTAKACGRTVTRRVYVSVRPSSPYETRVTSGYFRTGSHELKAARRLLSYKRQRSLFASSSPVALLEGLGIYMKNYPYNCTEQTTSRAIVAAVLAKAVLPGSPWKADAVAMMDRAEVILHDRQGLNGGFGMWGSARQDDIDLNLHVAHYLVLTGATESLRATQLAGALERYVQERGWNTRHARRTAEAIYLLARMEKSQNASLMALRDALEQEAGNTWMQTATGMYIAASYALMQKTKEANELARACLQARKRAAGAARPEVERCDCEGEADVDALKCMMLACRHFPKLVDAWGYEDIAPMMEALKKDLFNTYDAAYVALAAEAYGDVQKQLGASTALWQKTPQGWQSLGAASPAGVQGTVPDGVEDVRVTLDQGDADLGAFFQLVEAGFEDGPVGPPVRAGLEVARDYLDESGNPTRSWKLGQPVTVRLRLRNLTDRYMSNVAITDLLPGATQVVAGSLEAGQGRQPGVDYVDMREDRNLFFVDLAGGKTLEIVYRLKPLNPGTFALPAVVAEHMYKRMFCARSGGGQVVVAP